MVAELAMNAVQHARTEFEVTIDRAGATMRVEVTDSGDGRPAARPMPPPQSLRGRGLPIVDSLADAWGVIPSPRGPGKTIWFQIGMPSVTPEHGVASAGRLIRQRWCWRLARGSSARDPGATCADHSKSAELQRHLANDSADQIRDKVVLAGTGLKTRERRTTWLGGCDSRGQARVGRVRPSVTDTIYLAFPPSDPCERPRIGSGPGRSAAAGQPAAHSSSTRPRRRGRALVVAESKTSAPVPTGPVATTSYRGIAGSLPPRNRGS